jgi:hypothetical protein
MLVTGNQLKAARALAAIDQAWVAKSANVALNTIRNMESRGPEAITSGAVTVRNVQLALERVGIEFTNGNQPGVRMKRWEPGEKVRLRENSEPYSSTFGMEPKEVATVEEYQVPGAQAPPGHFRLRLASGTVTDWLLTIYFEKA